MRECTVEVMHKKSYMKGGTYEAREQNGGLLNLRISTYTALGRYRPRYCWLSRLGGPGGGETGGFHGSSIRLR
jgi:hypothetical protein